MGEQAKHTPGPWEVCGQYVRTLFRPGVPDADGIMVADVGFGTWPVGQHEANAHLIAAAPDHALICWAMCVQDARWEEWSDGRGEFCFAGLRHSTKLDEFGAPILTPHLRSLLTAARDRSAALAKANAATGGRADV